MQAGKHAHCSFRHLKKISPKWGKVCKYNRVLYCLLALLAKGKDVPYSVMAMVDVTSSSLQEDSQLKSVGLV